MEDSGAALDGSRSTGGRVWYHERAARLAGFAERLNEELGFARSEFDPPLPERVEPAWSDGHPITLAAAVDYALASID